MLPNNNICGRPSQISFKIRKEQPCSTRALLKNRIRYTKVWVVNFAGSANCLMSSYKQFGRKAYLVHSLSLTFAICGVNDTGLKFFLIFVGVDNFGTGSAVDFSKAAGKTPSFMDVL